MQITTIGLDIAKSSFQVHGADGRAGRCSREAGQRQGAGLLRRPAALPDRAWRPAAAPTTGPAS